MVEVTMVYGSISLTRKHFFCFQFSKPSLKISLKKERIKKINFFIEKENTFCLGFEASTFHEN